ncbi:hypothetical protein [Parasediminibacterium sp. JCM 36343]|uniref:DUF7281 domain-containing protein n=1 Tax=Parasediminibacterium sp. JCM 36343 TaxID=3374279 RepID=UPI00397DD436
MKIPLHIAEKLLLLLNGKAINGSEARHILIDDLVTEAILERKGRIKKTLTLRNSQSLHLYLQNQCAITDLATYIETLKNENASRADFVTVSADSKLKAVRTFKGFLVNSYLPIQATLNNKPFTIHPQEGSFSFVYDFETFIPSIETTIVGIENPENFRYIKRQQYLFKNITPLFISRYPQNQSKDLIKWLQRIPNTYLHFGDYDFAGIGIYVTEFKKHLKEKATFFIPENIELLLKEYGNKERYNQQKINFNLALIHEPNLQMLINLLNQHKKGLDQEILAHVVAAKNPITP